MAYAIAAYLHFLAVFLLFALLLLEHQLLRRPLSFARARSLFRTDLLFGIVAGAALVSGPRAPAGMAKAPIITCRTACSTPRSVCSWSLPCCRSIRP